MLLEPFASMACRARAHIISGTQDCLSNQYIKKQHMTTIYVVTPMMELYGDVSPAITRIDIDQFGCFESH